MAHSGTGFSCDDASTSTRQQSRHTLPNRAPTRSRQNTAGSTVNERTFAGRRVRKRSQTRREAERPETTVGSAIHLLYSRKPRPAACATIMFVGLPLKGKEESRRRERR